MILYVWKFENNTFTKTAVIDYATSVIWIKRFNSAGEFEIYVKASTELFNLFSGDIFLTRDDSTTTMYVEKILLNTDDENGDFMTITGRSAECILGRRIIPKQTTFTGTAENCIRQFINDNIISPTVYPRRIPILSLGAVHGYTDMIEKQVTGKNLLETISDICVAYDYGFSLEFTGSGFVFELYKGTDRSFDQATNTFVVFSPDFENLGNTEYSFDKSEYVNSVYVAGEGEGLNRVIVQQYVVGKRGFDLCEAWVDARQTSSDNGEISGAEYQKILQQQGHEEIEARKELTTFSGEILNYNAYTYGVDYELGDKVSIKNEYGILGNATITEITEVEDDTGYRLIPTLSEWEVIELGG